MCHDPSTNGVGSSRHIGRQHRPDRGASHPGFTHVHAIDEGILDENGNDKRPIKLPIPTGLLPDRPPQRTPCVDPRAIDRV